MEDRIRTAFAEIHADDALLEDTSAYLCKEAEKRLRKGKRGTLSMRLAAVAAMAFLVVGFYSYSLYFTAVAHVSIDINPSLELALNRFDRVIDTYAFNEDGAELLSEVSLRGETYEGAAALLLSALEAKGVIAEDALISVTVQAATGGREQALCEALMQVISEKVRPVRASAEIEVFPVSSEVWNIAHGRRMSPAKYLAIQELMEVDETATIEEYAGSSIQQIRQCTQECRNGHNAQSSGGYSESGQQSGHGHGNGHGNRREQ